MDNTNLDQFKSPNDDTYMTDDIRDNVVMEMERSDEDTAENGDSHDRLSNHEYHKSSRDDYKNGSRNDSYRGTKDEFNIIQVINVAPSATLEQMTTLFSFFGDIVNIELYHSEQTPETNFKVCFVEFAKPNSVSLAQHLTNTIFIDRALFVLPSNKHKIPDRETALDSVTGSNYMTSFNLGVMSQIITGVGGIQMIATVDPRLTALGLPQYPQLPINTDPTRIEEIRRTVYIGNLDSTIPPDQVMKFFNDIGEVKYIRMAGDDTQPTRFAFVEFTNQSSVANALQHNGFVLGSRPLKINHSNNAIVKPQIKIDIDDTAKRMRDNHPVAREFVSSRDRHSSSRYDRDRDRTRDRDRDRYHDRRLSPRRRSRSRDRETSSRRRSRSRDRPSRRSRSRDKSSRSRRSRSRDSRRRRSRSRSSERSRSKHHKSSRR